jgi:hypothetical protein
LAGVKQQVKGRRRQYKKSAAVRAVALVGKEDRKLV